jgi:hypothetical protein
MTKISLSTKDLKAITEMLKKFNDIQHFELIKHSGSGIGYTLDLGITTQVNGIKCTVIVPVVDESEW